MGIASTSKAFTAFAVLQLVDSGNVDLDAPVTDYLPDFSVGGADENAITVRMLLLQTSGLTNPTFVETAGSLEGSVASIADHEVASEPGAGYQGKHELDATERHVRTADRHPPDGVRLSRSISTRSPEV